MKNWVGYWLLSASLVGAAGVGGKEFSPEEVYKPIGRIESSKPGVRGHAAMQMINGYLAAVEARDSGLGDAALAFFDISDPENPSRVATHIDEQTKVLFEGHNYGFVEIDGRDLVFLNAQTGLQIWDWTDVNNPRFLSALKIPGLTKGAYANTVWWLAMQYPYVYLGGTNTGVHIVDASDLGKPELLRSLPMDKCGGFKVGSLFACGNLLVCNSFDGPGISLLDISDPVNPKLLKVIKERFGYSGLFNGGYFYGIGEKPRVWDVREPEKANLVSSYDGPRLGSKGGYGVIQDGFLHQGASNGYAKVDVRDPKNPKLVKRVAMKIPHQDFDGANVIGQYVVMTCDHGTGSHIVAHQAEPDTQGPEVNYQNPRPDATQVALTSRVGLSWSDEIDHESLQGIVVQEVGGEPVAGIWSVHNALANFTPEKQWKAEATYEIVVPPGTVLDQVGNANSGEYRSKFSTGSGLSDFAVEITAAPWVLLGESARIEAHGPEGAEYSWDLGRGWQKGSAQMDALMLEAGRQQLLVKVQKGDRVGYAQASLLVHPPLSEYAPQSSSTIQQRDGKIWTVNPDQGTVSVIDEKAQNLVTELPAGKKPRTLAFAGKSVLVVDEENADLLQIDAMTHQENAKLELPHGARPYGIVANQAGNRAYISSQATGEVFVIDLSAKPRVLERLMISPDRALRGLALDADGECLYVTEFRSQGEEARVYQVALSSGQVKTIPLQHDAGPDTEDSGRGVPNSLSQIVISPDGSQAWVPSKKDNIKRGLKRDGNALTFENTVRAIASKLDLGTGQELVTQRHDFNDKEGAQSAVYSKRGELLFVACMGSNSVEVLDAYRGSHVTSILNVGSAPHGLAMNAAGDKLYVHNFLSRNVAIYDVSSLVNSGAGTVNKLAAVATVRREVLPAQVLHGKKVFHFAGDARMSRDGYISCASCHLDGDHDGQVWDFTDRGEGLRNTISLLGKSGELHGRFHWSGNFDEVQDFEHDIRHAFGGVGFMSNSPSEFQSENPLGYPKAGKSSDLDALAAYVRSLSKFPDSPFKDEGGELTASAQRGEKVFVQRACIDCHGGDTFTDSLRHVLHNVGTLGSDSGMRLGDELVGIDTPSLRGVWATAPYLHDGSAATLEDVLDRGASSGLHGNLEGLGSQEREDLLAYLKQIDGKTPAAGALAKTQLVNSTRVHSDDELARMILEAERTKKAMPPLSHYVGRGLSLEEGYRVQNAFDQHMEGRYGKPTGYKLAFASKSSQKKWGVDGPVAGTFFQKQEVASGGSVAHSTFIGFHIESEIAFKLKRDIRRPLKSLKEVDHYIQSVHVSLDVPDLRYDLSKGKLSVGGIAGMSCGTHTYVLGKGVPLDKVDFSKMRVSLKLDGKEVYAGEASNVLGDPREALRVLANQKIKAGQPLRRSQVVLTGAVTKAYFPKEAMPATGEYIGAATGLPSVRLRVK